MFMKYLFLIIFILVALFLAAGAVFLVVHFADVFSFKKDKSKLSKKELNRARLLALIPVGLLAVWCVLRPYVGAIVTMHLIILWAIFDLFGFIICKISGKRKNALIRFVCAALVTAVLMTVGYYLAHNAVETDYSLKTDKNVDDLRVALIADSHVGACFDGEGFAKYMKEIEAQEPDVLVISGDFIDDDTTYEDMVRSCKALGELKTKLGIYYVNGNHDKGYSNYRGYSYEDLIAELEKNNVVVLEDQVADIGGGYCVVGRIDKSYGERMAPEELLKQCDGKYAIVLDHQPNDYDAEEKAGCDLVLSGHTHAGQLVPVGQLAVLFGINDNNYGLEKRSNTDFIVTSGLGDWAIPIRTGCQAEYCIIDISNK